jgi:hypothetical protein
MEAMKISLRECLFITLLCAMPLGVARLDIAAGLLLTFLPCAYCVWRCCAQIKAVSFPFPRIMLAGFAGALATLAMLWIHLTFFFVPQPNVRYSYWEVAIVFLSSYGFLGGLIVGCVGEFCLHRLRMNEARNPSRGNAGP